MTMNDVSIQLIGKLKKILDDRSIIIEEEHLKDYKEDMGGFVGAPLVVVKPRSEEDIVKIVRLANQLHVTIIPRGAGTSLTGAVVSDGAVILDMSNFNRILKIDTVNWYVHVQAGVVLDDMNSELKKYGFFFPPDPASSFACTVGGAISEGSGGMRCLRYGTMKDWVLSARIVLPNGILVTFGEPLYKNRAGYDLLHLIIGSEGTLGIITEAHLKIIPISPIVTRRILASFSDWTSAGKAIRSLRESKILPLLLEFMDRETIVAVNRDIEHKLQEAEASLLLDTEQPETERVAEILRVNGAKSIRIAANDEEAEELYQARVMAYLSVKSLATGVQIEDVVVPIDCLAEYLDLLKDISHRLNVRIAVMGHAGDGNVHPVILFDKDKENERIMAERTVEEICKNAIRLGGSITGEHGVGIQKVNLFREQLVAHNGEETLQLMKRVKKLFDANSILNPDKYVEAA